MHVYSFLTTSTIPSGAVEAFSMISCSFWQLLIGCMRVCACCIVCISDKSMALTN